MNQNIPQFLIEMLNKQYGENIINKIIDGFNQNRPVTFRVNTLKTTTNAVCQELDKFNIQYEKVSWSNEALIIKNVQEKQIQELDIYKNGEIYLQSLYISLFILVFQHLCHTNHIGGQITSEG